MNARLCSRQLLITPRVSSLFSRVPVSAPKMNFATSAPKTEKQDGSSAPKTPSPTTTTTAPPPIYTKINVKDVCCTAVIGINPEERETKQYVFMDINYTYDAAKCIYVKEDMSNGIHYGEVSRYAKAFIKEKQFKLLENCVFETMIAIIRKFPQLRRLEITVKKPEAVREAESTECSMNSTDILEAITARLRHDRENNVPVYTPSAEILREAKIEEQAIARDKAFNDRQMAEMMAQETMRKKKSAKKSKKE